MRTTTTTMMVMRRTTTKMTTVMTTTHIRPQLVSRRGLAPTSSYFFPRILQLERC
jgi:hypothetical protein